MFLAIGPQIEKSSVVWLETYFDVSPLFWDSVFYHRRGCKLGNRSFLQHDQDGKAERVGLDTGSADIAYGFAEGSLDGFYQLSGRPERMHAWFSHRLTTRSSL